MTREDEPSEPRNSTPAMISGDIDLTDQTAVVTGAGGGIGTAICSTLADDGADVVAADIDASTLAETADTVEETGSDCLTVECDVADPDSVERLRDRALDGFEAIEIVVTAHGVVSRTPFADQTDEELCRVIDINLSGTVRVVQAFYEQMITNGYGKIVTIGSIAGRTGRRRASTTYSAAKAGVHGFTRSLSREAAPKNIYVNSIAPGPVRTPMTDDGATVDADEFPLGRIGEPDDIAQAVRYLASQQSQWTSGTVLDVNGGAFTR
jgi:3-oxoacyl-[acyl-carrier protein] reductase